jgi:hypothetical protein
VDPGASTYLDIINRVPVATSGEMTLVDLAVRDRIFPLTDDAALAGAGPEAGGNAEPEEEGSDSESDQVKKHKYPKRGRALFRASSTTEVPCLFSIQLCEGIPSMCLMCRSVVTDRPPWYQKASQERRGTYLHLSLGYLRICGSYCELA